MEGYATYVPLRNYNAIARAHRIQYIRELLAGSPDHIDPGNYYKKIEGIRQLDLAKEKSLTREYIEKLLAIREKKAIEPKELAQTLAAQSKEAIEATIRYARADIGSYITRRLEDVKKIHDRELYRTFYAKIEDDIINDVKEQTGITITEKLAQALGRTKGSNLAELMAMTFKEHELKEYAYETEDFHQLFEYIRRDIERRK